LLPIFISFSVNDSVFAHFSTGSFIFFQLTSQHVHTRDSKPLPYKV
jgi:hypothetical protein